MSLKEEIIAIYPELENSNDFGTGIITLRNDSDGTGDYIETWNYSKPLDKSLEKYLRA